MPRTKQPVASHTAGAGGASGEVWAAETALVPTDEDVFVQVPSWAPAVRRYGDLIGRCVSKDPAAGHTRVAILGSNRLHEEDIVDIDTSELEVYLGPTPYGPN